MGYKIYMATKCYTALDIMILNIKPLRCVKWNYYTLVRKRQRAPADDKIRQIEDEFKGPTVIFKSK